MSNISLCLITALAMDPQFPRARLSPIDETSAPFPPIQNTTQQLLNDADLAEQINTHPSSGPATFERLPYELLGEIIPYLDPPTTVCFALTCKDHHKAVLAECKVAVLEDVCPRDVRKRFPKTIEDKSYNILDTDPQESNHWRSCRVSTQHYLEISETALAINFYYTYERRLMSQHLAYIRHVEWFVRRELERDPTLPVRLSQTLIIRSVSSNEERRIPMPTELCKAYIRSRVQDILAQPFSDGVVDRELWLLGGLWGRAVIESVEFMTLRLLLGEQWIVIEPNMPGNSTKRREEVKSMACGCEFVPMPEKQSLVRRIMNKVSQKVRKHVEKMRSWKASS